MTDVFYPPWESVWLPYLASYPHHTPRNMKYLHKLAPMMGQHLMRWPSIHLLLTQQTRNFEPILIYYRTTVCGAGPIPANTKHLYNICTMSAQLLRRWSNIVQMLCQCFVFAGIVNQHWLSVWCLLDINATWHSVIRASLLIISDEPRQGPHKKLFYLR